MEWRRKEEVGEDDDQDESPNDEKPRSVGNAESEIMGGVEIGDDDDDDEWVSENSEKGDIGDENEAMKGFAHSVSQIKRLWGEGYWKQVTEVESKVKVKEAEYNEFLERHQ